MGAERQMKRKFLIFLLIVAFLLSTGFYYNPDSYSWEESQKTLLIDNEADVIIIGDSRVYLLMVHNPDIRSSTCCRPGSKIEWLEETALPSLKTDKDIADKTIVIMSGVNNMLEEEPKDIAKHMKRIYDEFTDLGADVVLCNVGPTGKDIDSDFNKKIIQYNKELEKRVPSVVDLHGFLVENGYEHRIPDDIWHYDAETDRKILNLLEDMLNKKGISIK